MEKFRIGLYGCGGRTRQLIEPAIRSGTAEVILCYDLNAGNATQAAINYGAKACSLDELLSSVKVEMLLIALFPAAHPDALLTALKSGKPIYIEKPVAVTMADVRKLLPVMGTGYVHVGLSYQYFSVFRKLTELVESGKIGKLVEITFNWIGTGHDLSKLDKANWRLDPATGGELTQHYCHCFEWFRRLGGNFTSIMASSLQVEGNHTCLEDVWDLIIRQKSGSQICFHSSSCNPRCTAIGWLEGTNGSLEWEWSTPSKIIYYPYTHSRQPGEIIQFPENAPDAVEEFIKRFRNGEPPQISLEDGLWSILPPIYARESAVKEKLVHFPGSLAELNQKR